MRKSAPFQIAGKLRGILTDNSFKRVQITYLCVISNLDKLVQPSYTLSKSDRWQALEILNNLSTSESPQMPGQGHRPCSSHMSLVDLDGMLPPHMFWLPEPTSQVPLPTGQLEETRKASGVTIIVPTKPTKISSEGLPTRQGVLCFLLRT